MKYIGKNTAILIIIFIMLAFLYGSASAQTDIIHETSLKQTITSGATLESIKRFTVNGWLSINIMRVDTGNPNINIDVLADKSSIRTLKPVKELTEAYGAVAAINGSFFNRVKDAAGSILTYPDGPAMQSGKILSANYWYNRSNDVMTTLSIDKFNKAFYDYWKTDITLTAKNGKSISIKQYNKPSKDYTDYTIIDSGWGEKSVGASDIYPDIVEVVVSYGRIMKILKGQPPVNIPRHGFVLVTRQAGSKAIDDNFKLAQKVKLDVKTTPDWNNMKAAVTGSSILVRDGAVPDKFTYDIPAGRHPRTAFGNTKDGGQLIMVTVDGRQDGSIGMTLAELAKLMVELGAYNAVNLDGGGSTTMVARTPGTGDIDVVNSPSDGLPRAISNAIGVFSTRPPSPLKGLIIEAEDANVFLNTSRSFTVKGYDSDFNPVTVDPATVSWSVSGVRGSFTDNTLYPKSIGNGKVTASINNITAEFDISVLSSPVQLQLSDLSLTLQSNQTVKLTVSGKNRYGYHAVINPADIKWQVTGDIGNMDKGTFTASDQGAGYIDASIGNVHAYCTVTVESVNTDVADDFEAVNGSFLSYPSKIKGSYEISTEQKHSGKSSGKLSYDFSDTEDKRATYFVLADKGLPLDENTIKIGLWVYNTHENSNWLSAEVQDSDGVKHLMYFKKNLDWIGWKYVELSLEGIGLPAKLAKIYLVQVNPDSDAGFIYLDDLTLTTSGSIPASSEEPPQDTKPVDEANKSISYKKSADSFRFSVFGQSHEPANDAEKQLLAKLSDKVNRYLEASAFVGGSKHEIAGTVKKPFISTNKGYKTIDIMNSRMIQLDMSSQGLRASDPAQWQWLLKQLDSAKGNNIFIFLANSTGTFSDRLEAGLFQDILTEYRQKTGKNIWVFYYGSENTSYMERGIKYISTSGFDVEGFAPENTGVVKYLLVTVQGNSVIYEFKPI